MMSEKEWDELNKKAKILRKAAEIVRVEDKDLIKTITRFQKELEEWNKILKK